VQHRKQSRPFGPGHLVQICSISRIGERIGRIADGIVGEQDVLNQTTLVEVKMPNRNGFVADPRPDIVTKKPK
jgi:hypothetical protein